MDEKRLREIIESHGRWLRCEDGSRANLREANLWEADLREANLWGADLWGADLREADLREANLRGADLWGADLWGADLRGADLPQRIVQVGPLGSRKDYTVCYIEQNLIKCGCWTGTIEEFKKRIDEVYPQGPYRRDYMSVVAMLEVLYKGVGK